MNCPNCKTQLKDKDLTCPKCKKVVRLQCPNCQNITKKTICEKCGSVILNKCYKCGKLNSTNQNKCPQCGLDINASIGLRESIIEEFAVLTIEITNFDEFKTAFKSDTLTKQFKQNLFSLIKKTGQQKQLRVQFIDNTFIIRFCKDVNFKESCLNAIDFAIYVAQTVTQINKKLFDAKGITLKTQMAIQKRDVYAKPSEYKSGININIVYSTSGASHLFNNIELVADSFVYQETKDKFPYQSLSAIQIKNRMVMFFELILHKVIDLKEQEKAPKQNAINLPQNLNYEPDEEIEDKNLISFRSLNCTFIRANGENLLSKLKEIASKNSKNPIISIKTTIKNNILPLITKEELENTFTDTKLYYLTSTTNDKYTPYGLLKSILLAYYNVSEIETLINPLLVDAITTNRELSNLLKMILIENQHPEDIKFSYYEAFGQFFENITNKTLFVINDFDNADETSIEIIKYLFEKKQLGEAGFLVTNNDNYSVHRKIYKLMTSENYFEIEMKPSSNKTILSNYYKQIKKVKDSFFIEKVIENTKGSRFYFTQALEYLVDNEILKIEAGKYEIQNDQMILIPKSLNELIQKRLISLKSQYNLFEIYGLSLLLGPETPIEIIQNVKCTDLHKAIKTLENKNLLQINNNKLKINNYNLYKTNFLETCNETELSNITKKIKECILNKTQKTNVIQAEIAELEKNKKEAFKHWHNLAIASSQLGDFCAYFNNTNKFLSFVDNVIDEETDKNVDQIKMEVYAELASILYKYYPEKTLNYLDSILSYLENQNDDTQIKEIANKLVQSCLISGNYNNALEYIGKIISRTTKSSFNPKDKNFNINYFLINLVTLEIYFNLGRLNECIELGEELFKYIGIENEDEKEFLEDKISKKEFNDAILDGLFFVNTARIIQLKPDRKEKLSELIKNVAKKYTCFELLALFNDFFANKDIIPSLTQIAQNGINDKYSLILFPILQGLTCLQSQNWENFGNYIYNAKLKARAYEQHQMNYFCDLMIGYAYLQLDNIAKAKEIFYSVLDTASEKGLKNIILLSWYFIANAEYKDKKVAITLDIINKTLLKMEKDTNSSNYFLLAYKTLFARVNAEQNPEKTLEETMVCAQQAYSIAVKNELFTNLPLIADLLIFVYTIIIQNTENENIKKEYGYKIDNIKVSMQKIFS